MEHDKGRTKEAKLNVQAGEKPRGRRTLYLERKDGYLREGEKKMFAKETDGLVEQLVDAEYRNACETYGKTYPDRKNGCEVLREEIEEVCSEHISAVELLNLWINGTKPVSADVLDIAYERVVNSIKENAQVLAVVKKIKNSIESWSAKSKEEEA